MKAKKQLLGFTAASLTLGAVFMAGGAPIPFYHTYAETLGLDKGVLSLATVAYFAGTVIALLFLPQRLYFRAMKYERYIMLAVLALVFLGLLDAPLSWLVNGMWRLMLHLTGFVELLWGY